VNPVPRLSFPRSCRPVHAVLLVLGCAALVIPVISNLDTGNGVVEATYAYVSRERPIDRILNGTALGSRRIAIAPEPAPRPAPALPPRLVQPGQLTATLRDTTPDLTDILLPTLHDDPAPSQEATPPEKRPAIPHPRLTLPRYTAPAIPDRSKARPAAASNTQPRIALVVTAVGLHEAITQQAIRKLPKGVTLAFAPIGERIDVLAKTAIDDGHTVLVEIPMEPINPRRDPGEPLTLRVSNTNAVNLARLDKALSRVPGAAGISSYLGARFNRSDEAASPVVQAVASRGLFLFENQPSGQSRLGALAKSHKADYAAGLLAIDKDRDEAMILDRLSALEQQARRDGVAIGVATAYRGSIATLERWVESAEERGIVFVPVTHLKNAG